MTRKLKSMQTLTMSDDGDVDQQRVIELKQLRCVKLEVDVNAS